MKLVYVAHPLAGDIAKNIAKTKRWLRWIYQSFPDVAPIAPWVVDADGVLDDTNPSDRERGIKTDLTVIRRCDEIWLVGGRISFVMQAEMYEAERTGVSIRDLTDLGGEPPTS